MYVMNQLPTKGEFKVLKLKQGAQAQITDYLRDEICSGTLKPGAKLPATQELAQRWETHTATVHKAMEPLVKEGLLIRMIRKGTFVRQREEKLTCVGVYSTANVKGSPYAHAVREAMSRELHEAGIEMDLWMDPRSPEKRGEAWSPLVKAAEQRRFQAFIGVETDMTLLPWQQKLPVPRAFLGVPSPMQNSVTHDMRHFVEISLGELARQGCRSVGLIFPVLASLHVGDKKGSVGSFDILEDFMDIAGELGLTVKNDWMHVVRGPLESQIIVSAQERFGYDGFLKLWSQPEKPEGLMIFTDVVARGALMAIREKQVRVPEELKLVLHKNESIDLFCPMPATFVVSSEREVARALIGQVQKQFNGETCERISLPFKIVAHNNP